VYSSVIKPIKDEDNLVKHLALENNIKVKIYTKTKRVICDGSITDNANSKILLKHYDIQQVKLIEVGDEVKLVEVIENGHSVRGMRECRVSVVDYVNGLVTIESNIQLGI